MTKACIKLEYKKANKISYFVNWLHNEPIFSENIKKAKIYRCGLSINNVDINDDMQYLCDYIDLVNKDNNDDEIVRICAHVVPDDFDSYTYTYSEYMTTAEFQ
jgi:hypothetical protein